MSAPLSSISEPQGGGVRNALAAAAVAIAEAIDMLERREGEVCGAELVGKHAQVRAGIAQAADVIL